MEGRTDGGTGRPIVVPSIRLCVPPSLRPSVSSSLNSSVCSDISVYFMFFSYFIVSLTESHRATAITRTISHMILVACKLRSAR